MVNIYKNYFDENPKKLFWLFVNNADKRKKIIKDLKQNDIDFINYAKEKMKYYYNENKSIFDEYEIKPNRIQQINDKQVKDDLCIRCNDKYKALVRRINRYGVKK